MRIQPTDKRRPRSWPSSARDIQRKGGRGWRGERERERWMGGMQSPSEFAATETNFHLNESAGRGAAAAEQIQTDRQAGRRTKEME